MILMDLWICGLMDDGGVGHTACGVVFFAGLAFIRLDFRELVGVIRQERMRSTGPPEHWTTGPRKTGPWNATAGRGNGFSMACEFVWAELGGFRRINSIRAGQPRSRPNLGLGERRHGHRPAAWLSHSRSEYGTSWEKVCVSQKHEMRFFYDFLFLRNMGRDARQRSAR